MSQDRSASEQLFVDGKLDDALSEAGLPVTSPIRGILNRDCEVFDGVEPRGQKSFGIKIPRPSGDISLRERLDELKRDAMYKHNFPKETPSIAAGGGQCIRPSGEDFADIVSGKRVVR
jgi:hypothetical protein